jgi:hypothetical protein
MSDTFEYSDKESYDQNFNRWYGMNSIEKRKENEEPHTLLIGRRIFNEQYGNRSIKDKINSLLKDR